jgi:predicted AAA+ superfamily ATPase
MQKIRRKLFNEVKNHLKAKEISLIVGPRQAGKTTLMTEIMAFLEKKGEKTLFLNLDYENDKKFFSSQEDLIKKLDLELGGKKGFVFIDEIQKKENAGLFLKGIYDLNLPYKFIISGSGSLELKEKIHESLAGRKRLFELGTVSFKEFVDFKTDYKYSEKLDDFFNVEKETALRLLEEFLNFGGYPRIVLEKEFSEKNKLINEIFRSYTEKDISYFLGINQIEAFNLLIKVLANQTGQIIQYSDLAQKCGISVQTLKNYLWYAEKTFSIRIITPYFKNKNKEITKSPSVYFYDNGMRNFALGLFGILDQIDQKSFVFQNLVANRLFEKNQNTSNTIHFWRTIDKAEVDFVVNQASSILPVEVKYSNFKKPQVTRSFRSFLEKYSPKEAWVVNLNLEEEIEIGATRVKFIPYYRI